jgi:hypothetical protein
MFGAVFSFCQFASAQSNDSFKPVNLAVNTEKDEDYPHSSVRNGVGHLYFTRNGELHSAARNGQSWNRAKPFEELTQHRGDYRSIFVSYTKSTSAFPQYMIYATNKDANKPDGRGDNFDLFMKLREGPSDVDVNVAIPLHFSTADDEMYPWLTANGTLYFSRKTQSGWRLYSASAGKAKMTFNKPEQVGFPDGFHHATLSPDGKTMYLQGPLEKGRTGLFRSKLENGKWSNPEELKQVNDTMATKGDMSPNLTRDGSLLYFVSDRNGGKGGLDIWAIPVEKIN